jgi:hypothetical protein
MRGKLGVISDPPEKGMGIKENLHSLDLIWQRGIEIGTYCDERLSGAGLARRRGLRERHQSRHRLASLGDDDFLAVLDPLKKLGVLASCTFTVPIIQRS